MRGPSSPCCRLVPLALAAGLGTAAAALGWWSAGRVGLPGAPRLASAIAVSVASFFAVGAALRLPEWRDLRRRFGRDRED